MLYGLIWHKNNPMSYSPSSVAPAILMETKEHVAQYLDKECDELQNAINATS